jgi:hypothetical protein
LLQHSYLMKLFNERKDPDDDGIALLAGLLLDDSSDEEEPEPEPEPEPEAVVAASKMAERREQLYVSSTGDVYKGVDLRGRGR